MQRSYFLYHNYALYKSCQDNAQQHSSIQPAIPTLMRTNWIAVISKNVSLSMDNIFIKKKATNNRKTIVKLTPMDEVIWQMHYADNWQVSYEEKINSVYYDKTQINNHPMVTLGLAGGRPQEWLMCKRIY